MDHYAGIDVSLATSSVCILEGGVDAAAFGAVVIDGKNTATCPSPVRGGWSGRCPRSRPRRRG